MQSGTGSRFQLLPPENATGNWVKVVQRLPVKIVFDPAQPGIERLAQGMSAVVTVDTRNHREMVAEAK
jgi:membrane fusion protein (multidrug efflux system)